MKKTISIALIAVLLFNIAGFLLVFQSQVKGVRQSIKTRVKSGIPEKELTVISTTPATASELKWKEENKEFVFKGQMYDVVRKEAGADGKVTYFCITDKQETVLFANLDEMVKSNMDSGKNAPAKNLLKIFLSVYFVPDNKASLVLEPVNTITYHYSGTPVSPVFEIVPPPPKG